MGALALSLTTCIHCGAPLNRSGVKFCPKCGKPQEGSAPLPTVTSAPTTALRGDAAGEIGTSLPTGPLVAPLPAQGDTPAARDGGESPRLIVQDEGQTHEISLGGHALLLGRAPDNDIVLRSRFVSARHARI